MPRPGAGAGHGVPPAHGSDAPQGSTGMWDGWAEPELGRSSWAMGISPRELGKSHLAAGLTPALPRFALSAPKPKAGMPVQPLPNP